MHQCVHVYREGSGGAVEVPMLPRTHTCAQHTQTATHTRTHTHIHTHDSTHTHEHTHTHTHSDTYTHSHTVFAITLAQHHTYKQTHTQTPRQKLGCLLWVSQRTDNRFF